MGAFFPAIGTAGRQAFGPFKQTLSYDTDIAQFQNGSEQRFSNRGPLWQLDIPYAKKQKSDMAALRSFFIAARGRAATNLQLLTGPLVYQSLTLSSDEFTATENQSTLYDTTLTAKQIIPQYLTFNSTPAGAGLQTLYVNQAYAPYVGQSIILSANTVRAETVTVVSFSAHSGHNEITAVITSSNHVAGDIILPNGLTFPSINLGLTTQLPYTVANEEFSDVQDSENGERLTFAYYGAALTGFPTTALFKAQSANKILSDLDTAKLIAHFMACQGRFASFTYPDPESGTNITSCRYDSDTLAIITNYPNNNEVSFSIAQTN